ncbi:MAG: ThuA domain-containing protein, partial [Planctomycetaceae bacterium]|nr:ThuA domain-containing protein [Planctomycetaceae bacterium]
VVFIAGKKSHGYGAHEHKAGCMLLAKALEENMPGYEATVVTNGWPTDHSVFEGANSIVIYCDGGSGHPINEHLEEVDALMKKGVGLTLIHYAVEVPKEPSGKKFLDWTGGFFEMNWSVNPHWTASFDQFPDHPITRGVKPFKINDEWYYHMRFVEGMKSVTPILTDVPPASTLERPDGPHSGNPYVRAEQGQPQHVAWAREREDGGRGFGFTGGHIHWNWGNDSHRKLVLNAIVWTAGGNVPESGVLSATPTLEELEANQDYPKPDDYNPARIQRLLSDWKIALAN